MEAEKLGEEKRNKTFLLPATADALLVLWELSLSTNGPAYSLH